MDDFSDNESKIADDTDLSSYPTETIIRISPSKKIMLLSNLNKFFNEGDFLSLIYEKKLMVRVLCAKQVPDKCGIKLIRIYDDQLWSKAYAGMQVQVLRGDDAQFKSADKKNSVPDEDINSLEDLYRSDDLESDEIEIDENKNRLLKNDNIVGLSYGSLKGVDNQGDDHYYGHWHVHWAYQMADNFWAEAMIGQAVIGDFPPTGSNSTLTTQITSFTIRIKYAFKAPFYSYFLPYVGYQRVVADSPSAGQPYIGSTAEGLQRELEFLDMMEKSGAVVGVTLLKRIVPGWFITGNLGTDFVSAGLALEF